MIIDNITTLLGASDTEKPISYVFYELQWDHQQNGERKCILLLS